MQVIFKICCLYRIQACSSFIETIDATGFVSVIYPNDNNHIQDWGWKNFIKRYQNHERMYICNIAEELFNQCSHFICGS